MPDFYNSLSVINIIDILVGPLSVMVIWGAKKDFNEMQAFFKDRLEEGEEAERGVDKAVDGVKTFFILAKGN